MYLSDSSLVSAASRACIMIASGHDIQERLKSRFNIVVNFVHALSNFDFLEQMILKKMELMIGFHLVIVTQF